MARSGGNDHRGARESRAGGGKDRRGLRAGTGTEELESSKLEGRGDCEGTRGAGGEKPDEVADWNEVHRGEWWERHKAGKGKGRQGEKEGREEGVGRGEKSRG